MIYPLNSVIFQSYVKYIFMNEASVSLLNSLGQDAGDFVGISRLGQWHHMPSLFISPANVAGAPAVLLNTWIDPRFVSVSEYRTLKTQRSGSRYVKYFP